jgi:hypothetical protein
MPMEHVPKDQPLTKAEFHRRLRDWIENSGEDQIGSTEVYQQTAWISVRDGDKTFGLHPDTKKDAVKRYLDLVNRHGDDIAWQLTNTRKGNLRAVLYGPLEVRDESFYLYLKQ